MTQIFHDHLRAALSPCLSPRPRLFVDVQHGLCNRLRAMASAAAIAARTRRQLVVIWVPDHHCEARIGDVLSYDGLVIEDRNGADLMRGQCARIYNYIEIEDGAHFQEEILPEGEPYHGQDIYIRSAYTLNSRFCADHDEQIFLRGLCPSQPVLALMRQVVFPSDVAVHIRMSTGQAYDHLSYEAPHNWPQHRHEELTAWREKSNVERFIARLDRLLTEQNIQTVFVAADLESTYEDMMHRYGHRVRWLKRRYYDRSVEQIQYAFADIMLLGAAPLFLASSWSSFSDVAQRLARPGRRVERSGYDF